MKAKNIGFKKVAVVSSLIIWAAAIVVMCLMSSCSSTKSTGIGHQFAPTSYEGKVLKVWKTQQYRDVADALNKNEDLYEWTVYDIESGKIDENIGESFLYNLEVQNQMLRSALIAMEQE